MERSVNWLEEESDLLLWWKWCNEVKWNACWSAWADSSSRRIEGLHFRELVCWLGCGTQQDWVRVPVWWEANGHCKVDLQGFSIIILLRVEWPTWNFTTNIVWWVEFNTSLKRHFGVEIWKNFASQRCFFDACSHTVESACFRERTA